MKISDIINRKKEDLEVSKLKQQREEVINETSLPIVEEVQQPRQSQSSGFFGNRPVQHSEYDRPMTMQEVPQPSMSVRELAVKLSVFLENGQKLPVVFKCPEDKIDLLMETVDQKIIDGEMITLGDFKFPGSRVMYMDLLGR